LRPHGCNSPSAQGERGGIEGGRGQGDDLVRADAPMSARTQGRVRADALMSARTQVHPCGRARVREYVCADARSRSRGRESFYPRELHNGRYSAYKSRTTQRPSSERPSVRASVGPSARPSVRWSIRALVRPSVRPSVCRSVGLSVGRSVRPLSSA
jgi:hypothetical protein